MQADLGVARSTLTGVYAVFMLVLGLSAPVVGQLFDRLGARTVYLAGLVVLAGAFWLASVMTAIWQYYLAMGLLAGFGASALGIVPATALLARWFETSLPTVMGLAYACVGLGVLVMLPLTQLLLDRLDWRETYRVLAMVPTALAVLAVLLPLGRLGHGSDRWRRRQLQAEGGPRGWTLGAALRTNGFWGLFAVYVFTAYAAYAILPQAVAFLVESGFDALFAASALGVTGMLSVVGMVGVGWLAQRYGRRRVVTLSYLSSLTGIAALIAVKAEPAAWLVWVFVVFFGTMQGARGPVITTMTADLFRGSGLGAIYGAVTMGMGLGAAAGAFTSGLLHDLTGHYGWSFGTAVVALALGLAPFYLVPALRDRRSP